MQEQMTAVQKLIDQALAFCVNYGFQVIGAVIILIFGNIIAGSAAKVLLKLFQKKNLDITLSRFLAAVAKIIILAFAVIIALGKFGITIAPFIAALGAVAFGATMAIQGPLSNYGAGLSIILGRPFVVGNTISVVGISGVVQSVSLASTVLTDEDGVQITIPNKEIVGQIIRNSQTNKIVESVVGISYDSDPEKAIRIIQETLAQFSEVAKTPLPQVGIQAFADSSVNLGLRYWVPTAKYFQTSFQVNLAIFKALKAAHITIPFPQHEVRILSALEAAAPNG